MKDIEQRNEETETLSPPLKDEYGGSSALGQILPQYGDLRVIYHLYDTTPELRGVVDQKCRELCRNGITISPYHYYQCTNCGLKYNSPTHDGVIPDKCDLCGSDKIIPAKWEQRRILQKWYDEPWDTNGNKIKRVCRMMDHHLQISDTTYLIVDKLYDHNNGKITYEKVERAYVPHADTVHMLGNSRGEFGKMDPTGTLWVCINKSHRDNVIRSTKHTIDDKTGPICERCNRPTILAWAVVRNTWGMGRHYYTVLGRGEIIPGPGRYKQFGPYGLPTTITLSSIVDALRGANQYLAERMNSNYPQSGILVVQSDSQTELETCMTSMQNQRVNNPKAPPGLRVPTTAGSAKDAVNLLDTNESVNDIDISTLQEGRREVINAQHGTRPIQARSKEKSTVQFDVAESNKSVQGDQEHIQDILDKFCIELGVTDFHFVFNPVEKTDELRALQTSIASTDHAIKMSNNLGFDYKINSEGTGFIFSKEPVIKTFEPAKQGSGSEVNSNVGSGLQMDGLEGEPEPRVPSDDGGVGDGVVGAGNNTSPDRR
ncbi:MAG: hypothetical protein F4X97_02040 [Boseongicola sp. SB0662_bin_57]|nr:hypothetical protein [Boseongicola sp. SB0662_bin_57]